MMKRESQKLDLRKCKRCGDFMNKHLDWGGRTVCTSCGEPFTAPTARAAIDKLIRLEEKR